jgi:hypothetical protein
MALHGATPSSSDVERILQLIREHGADGPDAARPLEVLMGVLHGCEGRAARTLARHGPAVMDAVARRVSSDQSLWSEAMAHLAGIGTRESLALWTERFLDAETVDSRACFLLHYGPPHVDVLFPRLLDGYLPLEKCAEVVSLASAACRNGQLAEHPFHDRLDALQSLLDHALALPPSDDATEQVGTVCVALGFIPSEGATRMLAGLLEHADVSIRLEAAFGLAGRGDETGIRFLVDACRSPVTAARASAFLKELDLTPRIPPETRDPDFSAQAQFAEWLAHPNELARIPDRVEIVDKRTLPWPTAGHALPLWLVRYTSRDADGREDSGIGMVGSTTWCFFSKDFEQRPPEDIYALHCYWELQQARGVEEDDDVRARPGEGTWLEQWGGGALQSARVLRTATLSGRLALEHRRTVALASASVADAPGWVVLDGANSAWYPKAEMPSHTSEHDVLAIHVGRGLLGLTAPADRARFLRTAPAPPPPEEIVEEFRRLEEQVRQLSGKQRERALSSTWSPLIGKIEGYARALAALGRNDELRRTIAFLEPLWRNDGASRLGVAAYLCGLDEVAAPLLERGVEFSARGEEAGYLATLWTRRGRTEAARDLLVRCMKEMAREAGDAVGGDRDLVEEWFQDHRGAFLQLFPDLGDPYLLDQGLPTTTLPQ